MPLAAAGLVLATPDAPLLCATAVGLYAIVRAVESPLHSVSSHVWWLITGLALGAAFSSKYTSILLPVGVTLAVLTRGSLRARLGEAGPYVACVAAVIVFVPVLAWNCESRMDLLCLSATARAGRARWIGDQARARSVGWAGGVGDADSVGDDGDGGVAWGACGEIRCGISVGDGGAHGGGAVCGERAASAGGGQLAGDCLHRRGAALSNGRLECAGAAMAALGRWARRCRLRGNVCAIDNTDSPAAGAPRSAGAFGGVGSAGRQCERGAGGAAGRRSRACVDCGRSLSWMHRSWRFICPIAR